VHSNERSVSRTSRAAAGVAASILAAMGAAYHFTYEPAPEVAVRWQEGLTWDRRVDLERQFGLVRGRDVDEQTRTYDLVDIRTENIRALLEQPEIEDTGVIDRTTFTVPADARYGRGWMWVGNRWPAARKYRLVPVVLLACGAALAYGVANEIRARRKRVLRLLAFVLGSRRLRFEDTGERLADRGGPGP
jgi:hypothetical protein